MNILITGATGGLGRNCIELLHSKYNLVATGRNIKIGKEIEKKGITFHQVDLSTDLNKLEIALENIDIVVHCAALASTKGTWDDFYQANVVATQNLINLAKKQGVTQFIHISSPSVYYSGMAKREIKESYHSNFNETYYIQTKKMAEDVVLRSQDKSFRVVILRPRSLIGKFDQVILPKIQSILSKRYFPFFNEGEAVVDVTNIENVVHAIECCFKLPYSYSGEIYNVTNGHPMKIKDLVNLLSVKSNIDYVPVFLPFNAIKKIATIIDKIFKNKYAARYQLDLVSLDQTLDISKARTDLKYSPKGSVGEAIDQYLNWRKYDV